ncbi:MAG: hypothetical protein H6R07_2006 [Proteobacteria bacterium]|nr:hypothetical protein [Pseudomonadota bacterium]
MSETKGGRFYVVYAEPRISVVNGTSKQMHMVPVSNRYHVDIQSAKKEYDELSAKIGKLLGLVESVEFTRTSAM